jgi:hypothetical protein
MDYSAESASELRSPASRAPGRGFVSASDALREHVLDLLRRTLEARFEDAVRDFPAEFVNTNPPHVGYTPWHLIEHLRIGQWDIPEYVRSGTHVSPKWPEEYWPAKGEWTDFAGWTKSLDQFRADREALIALVANPSRNVLAPIPRTPGHCCES